MRVLAWFAVAGIVCAGVPALAQQDVNINLITVTGEASASVRPDFASLRAGVTTQGKTAQEASDGNNREMSAVLAALKEAGIAAKDVQTSRLSIQPLYDPNKTGKARNIGFQASNQVTVTVRDVGKVATVIDRVVSAGANDVAGLQFLVADPSKALDEARGAAIADARRKAEIYAQAAGARLGRAVMIVEEGSAPPLPILMRQAARSAAPIAVGEEKLRVVVTVSFQLMH